MHKSVDIIYTRENKYVTKIHLGIATYNINLDCIVHTKIEINHRFTEAEE